MSMQIADNFSYQGTKPLDARVKYATVADMAAVAASSLYDGIMAYVVATEKNYQWKSTNTVDPTLGKWRELESGGASADGKAESSAIAPVFDDTETYAAGDRVTYEDELYVFNKAHTGAWAAADADKTDVDSEIPDKLTSQQMQEIKDAFSGMNKGAPLRMMHYSTEEQVVGTWIDGKPVYQKTIAISDNVISTGNNEIAHNISDLDTIIYAFGEYTRANGDLGFCVSIPVNTNAFTYAVSLRGYTSSKILLEIGSAYNGTGRITECHITLQYTKTTDTPV